MFGAVTVEAAWIATPNTDLVCSGNDVSLLVLLRTSSVETLI